MALVALAGGACTPGASDGGTVLVASAMTDQILVLDAATGVVRDSVSLDVRRAEIDEPHGMAAGPGGRYWYATVAHGEPTLWKFERPENRLVGRVRLGTWGAARIGISPDGAVAFVPDYYRDDPGVESMVAVVSLHDLSVEARLTVCGGPHDAQVSPDGRWVAIACSQSDEIVLLDAVSYEVAARVSMGGTSGEPHSPLKPLNVVWGASGEVLYATLHGSDEVVAVDRSWRVVDRVDVGAGPAQLAIGPYSGTLVVANRRDGTASLLTMAPLAERSRVDLGVDHPHGVAVADGDGPAFIGYEGTTTSTGGVVALDLVTGEILWRRDVGVLSLGVMYLTAGP